MHPLDILRLAARAVLAYPSRAALILLAMSIGVGAVVMLTGLGDSARRYVVNQFASLGTHLVIVLPGRSETVGGQPPLLGETPRDLTLDDAKALLRSRYVVRVAPLIVGESPVAWRGLERDVTILGATADLQPVRQLVLAEGRFLPGGDPRSAKPLCVLGSKLRNELFGNAAAVGQWVTIGDRRYRVAGVLASKGHSVGIDFDDIALVPVASAQALFDSYGLFRVLVETGGREVVQAAADDIRSTIKMRHDGEDDVTIITQDSVLGTFDKILRTLTYGLSGIAAISLVVAGILIMNVMLVSVTQRTGEIGLLKAIGADTITIRRLFLTEALLLSGLGALCGLALGWLGVLVMGRLYPGFPFAAPWWAYASAVVIAMSAGLGFGVLPAARAARLDPVQALARR
ncbi:MAG: FtsX-like permease family protein [Methylococcaceae bacterium]|nr:MAG: FtsX-like permease family protein [Methylococcaceae bacterium]